MAYQTLYRKYRPNSFELVYGQDVIVKTLKNVINNDKLSHAYLFTGPRGTGKTSCAKLFAKAINCLNPKKGDACNECENCKAFNENSNPDIIEMDAASNNGVDEIREIKNKVNLVPSISKYKVYIIDEVHMLSMGAFNALLKTLEEPPEYVIFILATTDPQKIPATIISRCQRFDFKSISSAKMKECLNNIIKKEKIEIEENALDEIINCSNGGMRDAIGLLDQASSYCSKKISIMDIEALSGNVSDHDIITLFNDVLDINYSELCNKINLFDSNGKDFNLICEKMIGFVEKMILFSKKINIMLTEEEKNIFDKIDNKKLYYIFDFLSESLIKIKNSYQKTLVFEIELIQLSESLQTSKKTQQKEETEEKKETIVEKKKDVNTETDLQSNVSRETLPEKKPKEILERLKQIRINNILLKATKKDIKYIEGLWPNINDYLIDDKYKLSAGILITAKPVAASTQGIIVTLPLDSTVNRLEKEYDNSKKLIEEIYNSTYKIVYISEEQWKSIRPVFVEKIKNGNIKEIDEKDSLEAFQNVNNPEFLADFNELIETEEK